jgi:adenine phosphoribosyltransferase
MRTALSAFTKLKTIPAHAQGSNGMNIKDAIRTIPDHPRPGIMFRDITTLLGNARAFRTVVDQLVQPYAGIRIDKVAGIEARGFILGGAVAHQLSVGFVPVRKKGKLPGPTVSQDYELEYGTDTMEMHADALLPGDQVLIVDDLIATGGTAFAAVKLIEGLGAQVAGASFVVDLPELGGLQKLRALSIRADALCAFEGH